MITRALAALTIVLTFTGLAWALDPQLGTHETTTIPPSVGPPPVRSEAAGVTASLARLPLAFEPNTGQAPQDIRYVSDAGGSRLWLSAREARFGGAGTGTIRLRWLGGAPAPVVTPTGELPGKAHYLDGPDASRWRRNVPMYGGVIYRGIYPGIDLVFHGTRTAPEFDFIVAAGADPRLIRLELAGADSVVLQEEDIIATAGTGRLRLHKPAVYQEGASGRVPVTGRFRVAGRRITFEIGAYDRHRALVIDPVVTYSTYLTPSVGTASNDQGRGIGVDAAGNMYVAHQDGRIEKFSTDGQTLLYSTRIGDAMPVAMAVDAAGNAYVASTCSYPSQGFVFNCPQTPNSLGATGAQRSSGDMMTLISKLSPDGSTLLFSTIAGGDGPVTPAGIAVDPAGNIYATGLNPYGGFPQTRPAIARPGVTTGPQTFVQAIAADFSHYIYADVIIAGGQYFQPKGIAVDGTGAAYLTGTSGNQFPTTPGAFMAETAGSVNVAVAAKLAPTAPSRTGRTSPTATSSPTRSPWTVLNCCGCSKDWKSPLDERADFSAIGSGAFRRRVVYPRADSSAHRSH